jgi:hypothetical protein
MSTVVCDDDAKINLLLDKAPSCLKRLVHFRELKRETIARAKKQGMELFRFEEIERIGSANSHIHREKVRSETRGVYGTLEHFEIINQKLQMRMMIIMMVMIV